MKINYVLFLLIIILLLVLYLYFLQDNNEYYQTEPDNFKINKTKVNCNSINHFDKENDWDKALECLYYDNCTYNLEENICKPKTEFNNNCLYKSKIECTNKNEENNCYWVNNNNHTNNGVCVELRDKKQNVPCYGYDKDSCPVENTYDKFGDIIIDGKCKIDTNNCVEKKQCNEYTINDCPAFCLKSDNNCIDNDDLCKFKNESDKCRQINIKRKDDIYDKSIHVNRKYLPCSRLNKNECINNSDICNFEEDKNICAVKPNNKQTIFRDQLFKFNLSNLRKKFNLDEKKEYIDQLIDNLKNP